MEKHMKLSTTFWTDQVCEFSELLYINGKTKEVIFNTDLTDRYQTYLFFRNLSKFVQTPKVLKTVDSNGWGEMDYYQFAVRDVNYEGGVCPIKWFDLVITDNLIVSHDIAFETTLIKRNGVEMSFGVFPNWCKTSKLPKYREFNIKSRAYKFMGNQVKKSFKGP